MKTILQCSAGLDIHQKMIMATIQSEWKVGEIVEETREFTTFEQSLHELVRWLQDHQVQCVVMESTGIYWKRIYTLLEQAGVTTLVVNARHVKQVPGRKTDVKDSQWLATLARYGLLKASFIPPADLRGLRLVVSYRMKLVGQFASAKNRMHKILDDAGIRLGSVVSDINGISAKEIIQGIIEEKPISELVKHVRGRLKNKVNELKLALDCPLSHWHKSLLKHLQNHIIELEKQIQTIENELIQAMAPYQKSWELLQTIPGIDAIGAAMLIALLGTDMSQFGGMQQLCSWAGMCPGNNESAGKRKSGRTRKGNKLLRQLLCQMANAVCKTESQFKSKYQSLVIRRGHKRAIFALGHKILRVIYSVLMSGNPYQDPKVSYEELLIKKNAPRWIKMLKQYGYLNPAPAITVAVT